MGEISKFLMYHPPTDITHFQIKISDLYKEYNLYNTAL